jgi:hypothetical protein
MTQTRRLEILGRGGFPVYVAMLTWDARPGEPPLRVEWQMYQVVATDGDGGNPRFARRDAADSTDFAAGLDDAEVCARGDVKWDGMAQFQVLDGYVGDAHEMLEFLTALREVYAACQVLTAHDEGMKAVRALGWAR